MSFPKKRKGIEHIQGVGGDLFVAFLDDEGSPAGERDFGDTPEISLTTESKTIEHTDSDGLTKETVISHVISRKITGTIRVNDVGGRNLELMLGGSRETTTQGTTAVTDEDVGGGAALEADHEYQLGMSPTNFIGVRGIGSVSVKKGATTFVLNEDYELDATLGRIRVIPGGDLEGESGVTANYTPTAVKTNIVKSGETASREVMLRFVAKSVGSAGSVKSGELGINRDIVIPRASLRPTGDWSLKSESDRQSVSFEIDVLKPVGADLPQILVYSRPYTTT